MVRNILGALFCTAIFGSSVATLVVAGEQKGGGIAVQPLKSSIAEETFQTLLVMKALEALGYEVKPPRVLGYADAHSALANGDATFMANHWDPLHTDFYEAAGGDGALYREGVYLGDAVQGYLIDRRTATAFKIGDIAALKRPEVARLFDTDGDGKADLAGCSPAWGCAAVIEHHLDAYALRDTVTHHQDSYPDMMADRIQRHRQHLPILYYTWSPYWVGGVLVPGTDTVWLQVPFSSLPGERKAVDTALPDGFNRGFQVNVQRIVANRAWAEANPVAARLFEVMQIRSNVITAQNLAMHNGEDTAADIDRHADAWIRVNRWIFEGWLEQARAAIAE